MNDCRICHNTERCVGTLVIEPQVHYIVQNSERVKSGKHSVFSGVYNTSIWLSSILCLYVHACVHMCVHPILFHSIFPLYKLYI